MSLDFRTYAVQAKWAVYVNEGASAALYEQTGCPYPLGTPEAQAFIHGYNITTEAIKGK